MAKPASRKLGRQAWLYFAAQSGIAVGVALTIASFIFGARPRFGFGFGLRGGAGLASWYWWTLLGTFIWYASYLYIRYLNAHYGSIADDSNSTRRSVARAKKETQCGRVARRTMARGQTTNEGMTFPSDQEESLAP